MDVLYITGQNPTIPYKYTSQNRKEKTEKKKRESIPLWQVKTGMKGFLEKYDPSADGWRFFQKPEGPGLVIPG